MSKFKYMRIEIREDQKFDEIVVALKNRGYVGRFDWRDGSYVLTTESGFYFKRSTGISSRYKLKTLAEFKKIEMV